MILGLLALSATTAWAHDAGSHFRVDVDAVRRGGEPVVTGYVTNIIGNRTEHVWVALEALDGAGKVIGTTTAHAGSGPNFDRAFFSAPAIGGAVTYRARVASFDCVAF